MSKDMAKQEIIEENRFDDLMREVWSIDDDCSVDDILRLISAVEKERCNKERVNAALDRLRYILSHISLNESLTTP